MIINNDSNLTITVCTLNEEKNIYECISSLKTQNPYEIILVDGNSDDETRKIAENLKITVINAGRKGLAHQRKVAVENTKTKYVAMMDADHRPHRDALNNLVIELEQLRFDGIEGQLFSLNNSSYWDSAMEQNFIVDHNFVGSRDMIGTPCIYKTKVLKGNNYNPFFTGPSDDTDLCYRLRKLNYKLGVGSQKIFQKHRSNFNEFRKKFIWYGKGDAQFIYKHPERLKKILHHLLINYPLKKSYLTIKCKKPKFVPFFLMCGLFRFYGFVLETIKFKLGKKQDFEIYKT